jgi:hypothetical protein
MPERKLFFKAAESGSLLRVEARVHLKPGRTGPDFLFSDDDFGLRVPEPDAVGYLVVRPLARNWRVLVNDLDRIRDGQQVSCPAISQAQIGACRTFCGVGDGLETQGIRIGVVDEGFRDRSAFANLRFLSERPDAELPERSHGADVVRFLGGDGSGFGLCAEPEIFFFDAVDRETGYLRSDLITEGIGVLADAGCDVINLSNGEFLRTTQSTLKIVCWQVRALGTTCIAATGNSATESVAQPACYPEVIGIGGIGIGGVAPRATYTGRMERIAQEKKQTGRDGRGYPVYHNLNTSCGDGLDYVAPSIGMPFPYGNGIISDVEGTSYAAPIVTAILAASLARDETYLKAEALCRSQRARDVLKRISLDLGLPHDRQGGGCPVWMLVQ